MAARRGLGTGDRGGDGRRNREPGVTLEQIAADFGVHPITLSKWLRRADTDEGGAKPAKARWTSAQWWASQIVACRLDPVRGAKLIFEESAAELDYPDELQPIVDLAVPL
ncbi:transposase [Streptomyces atroolivaceus]|uniref:transposase n=1 Tax=Streptomyces atroolivaceus TaxID=66869 RepID=UPI003638DAB8